MASKISPNADVDPTCQLGKNVTVQSFAKIEADVKIGEGTWIGSNVTIFNGARIGKNCRIFPGAVIAAIPQDLKYQGEETIAEIGDNTIIRECVTVNKGTASKGFTRIGNNCLLMAYTHVAHDCIVGDNCIISNSVQVAGEVEIDEHAIIGGASCIHQFCRIGKHAFISGMSGVLTDVPPYLKVVGLPVSYQGINYIGLRRREFSKESIDNIHNIYRVIYQEGLNTSQAVESIQLTFEDSREKEEIIDFIKSSKRGIVKGLSSNGTSRFSG